MKNIIALLLVMLLLPITACGDNAPVGEPYFLYVHKTNPKLRNSEIAEIVSANKINSEKYHVNMFWHVSKSGYESGFKTEIGKTFVAAGHKYNSEPCYGIECLQVSTVHGMYPKLTAKQIKHKLLYDYAFAIEAAYRLDYANQQDATHLGFTSNYTNRVVSLILYNAGGGSWRKYHESLHRYLKKGGKLETITVLDWKKLGLNFREIFSLNYYVHILIQADILKGIIQNCDEAANVQGR